MQEEVSARDVARAALEQLTEVLGARHGTGTALMLSVHVSASEPSAGMFCRLAKLVAKHITLSCLTEEGLQLLHSSEHFARGC